MKDILKKAGVEVRDGKVKASDAEAASKILAGFKQLTREEAIKNLLYNEFENSGEDGNFASWTFGAGDEIDAINALSDDELVEKYLDDLGESLVLVSHQTTEAVADTRQDVIRVQMKLQQAIDGLQKAGLEGFASRVEAIRADLSGYLDHELD